MKNKMLLLFIAVLLVAILACAFGACNNEDDSLPEINFTEDMTYDEILDIWYNDVKSFECKKYKCIQDQTWELAFAYNITEQGNICCYTLHPEDSDDLEHRYAASFYEGAIYYDLSYSDYDPGFSSYIYYDYSGYNYDFSDINNRYKENMDYTLKNGIDDKILTVENNQLIITYSSTYKAVFSNFNKTELNVSELFGDYKANSEKQNVLKFKPLEDGTKCMLIYAGNYLKDVEIPETVDGRTVVRLGDPSGAFSGFHGCTVLTRITIPRSVISVASIGNCTKLKEINYGGTIDEWRNGANLSSDDFVVNCIDGSITQAEYGNESNDKPSRVPR